MKYITGWKKAAKRYDCSVPTLWREVKAGNFPAPVKISKRLRGWSEATLDEHDAKISQKV